MVRRLFAGLGNPGKEYRNTRHNVGQMFLDYWRERWGRGGRWEKRKDLFCLVANLGDIFLAKPLTFMNSSGEAVRLLQEKLSPKQIYIAHDELDLAVGKWKITFGKSSHLHKGVLSVEKSLKTVDFWRVRIGVDNRLPENRIPGEKYVLQNFSAEERKRLPAVFDEILKEILRLGAA